MKDKKVQHTVVSVEQSYSGPLPSPHDFAAYKQVLPSAPERIMQMAENIQKHRIESEMRLIKIRERESMMGMVLASFLCFSAWVLCAGLALMGMTDWLYQL